MKKLLLIMGDLATGKSTFGNILSKRYGVNVFYKDSMKTDERILAQIDEFMKDE